MIKLLISVLFFLLVFALLAWVVTGAYNMYATGRLSKRKVAKQRLADAEAKNTTYENTLRHIANGSDTLPILSASDALDRHKSPERY